MNLLQCTMHEKRTTTRAYSLPESVKPISPISNVVDDVEEDEIDYSPCIRQEAAGIRLQKIERMMIEEKIEHYNRWSAEHRKWAEKFKRLLETKDSSLQSYPTTLNLFQVAISECDQIAVRFDDSRKDLEKILRKNKKDEKGSVKTELEEERATVNEAKRTLDTLEKELRGVDNDLERIRTNLCSSDLNERKRNKLQERQKSFKKDRKRLTQEIQIQQNTYREAEKQYRTNTENIYQETQRKELTRLQSMPNSLTKFVKALKIDPVLLKDAIQNHDPETDLTSWKEDYFPLSFKQTVV